MQVTIPINYPLVSMLLRKSSRDGNCCLIFYSGDTEGASDRASGIPRSTSSKGSMTLRPMQPRCTRAKAARWRMLQKTHFRHGHTAQQHQQP